MIATQFSTPQFRREWNTRWLRSVLFAAILSLGIYCWITFLAKNIPRIFSAATPTSRLVLKCTQIGQSRRMAMICDNLVSEGQTTTLRGVTFHVDSVTHSDVGLTIDGKAVQLSLGDHAAVEFKTGNDSD